MAWDYEVFVAFNFPLLVSKEYNSSEPLPALIISNPNGD